jgi:hypothetical protein
MLRKVMYIFLIIFFVLGSIAAYVVVRGMSSVNEGVVAPVSDLVRQLVIPATAVILPNPTTIVNQINDLARLETASYELEKIVTAESGQDILWGALGEKLIFVAHGKVVAGMDFSNMSSNALHVVDPDTVMVQLPEAQIFTDLPILDNEKSYVADRDTGLLTRADPELETNVRRVAEQEILTAAQESDILSTANVNGQTFILNFLNGLGFENVIFSDGSIPTPPPFEQEIPKGMVVTPAAP